MSATYESTDDYTVCLSDAGRQKLADDQHLARLARVEPLYEKVRIGAIAGAVVSIALLVILHGV